MYPSSSPAAIPRPILKRHQTSRDYPSSHCSPDRFHGVHFPPSPVLAKTHLVHSPSTYDRSPIVVGENDCALPERGCPGRTYNLDDSSSSGSSAESARRLLHRSSDHCHPRAALVSQTSQNQHHRRTSSPMARTYTGTELDYRSHQNHSIPHTMPSLIPDVSSESDESDGFTSPPPDSLNVTLASGPSIPRPRVARASNTGFPNMTPCDDGSNLYASSNPSFLPHPPSSDDKPKRRKHRDQDGKPSSRRSGAARVAGDDASYTSFSLCKGLSNCSLDSSPGDCLDGF
ncbi:hypothetical protein CONPUDRAFT_168552 [Coniophora puteana RWD-64-598 SS2]|uniref:Uncharacterized protein n=1 Tax=Coniophora puteana (strain RWD-64-598) TaxID=741705 RepID=A0A5M3MC69_CONPW|nr:uncharacterized protein CONPUDRAFT_168552 [Coniophora puteana RWD-64-598 SS2]EIW76798.1 hypothetical protein CONPUDRAFT_168552 [Coniophora puteana RWD-64-598 SS2]